MTIDIVANLIKVSNQKLETIFIQPNMNHSKLQENQCFNQPDNYELMKSYHVLVSHPLLQPRH